jgi:chromosome segregation ATPase
MDGLKSQVSTLKIKLKDSEAQLSETKRYRAMLDRQMAADAAKLGAAETKLKARGDELEAAVRERERLAQEVSQLRAAQTEAEAKLSNSRFPSISNITRTYTRMHSCTKKSCPKITNRHKLKSSTQQRRHRGLILFFSLISFRSELDERAASLRDMKAQLCELAYLREEITQLRLSKEQQDALSSQLGGDLETVTAQNAAIRDQLAKLTEQYATLQQLFAEACSSLDISKQDVMSGELALQQCSEAAAKELAAVQENHRALSSRLAKMICEVKDMGQQRDTAMEELETLSSQHQALLGQHERVCSDVVEAAVREAALKVKLDSRDQALKSLEETLCSIEASASAAKESLAVEESRVEAAFKMLAEQQEMASSQQKVIDALESALETMKGELKMAQNAVRMRR